MRILSQTNPPELASPAGHLTNYTTRRHAGFPTTTTTRILEIDFMWRRSLTSLACYNVSWRGRGGGLISSGGRRFGEESAATASSREFGFCSKEAMVVTLDILSANSSSSTWRICSLFCWLVLAVFFANQQVYGEVFTNSFLVRLHGEPGNEVAHQVATRNGFENLGSVSVTWIAIFILYAFQKKCIYMFMAVRPEFASDIRTRSCKFLA